MKRLRLRWFTTTLSSLILVGTVAAWVIDDSPKWRDGAVTLRLQLPGSPASTELGATYNQVAAAAAREWNRNLGRVRLETVDEPNGTRVTARTDGHSQVFFDSRVRGESLGDGVLAVTVINDVDGVRGETDVVFNQTYPWDAYRGTLRTTAEHTQEMWRVALHEFGHVLGLGHPDQAGQGVNAIMNSRVSAADALYEDDILGAYTIYGAGPDTPDDPPAINATSDDVNLRIWQELRLHVVATGVGLRYQWERDGKDLPGATNAQFSVISGQPDMSGGYRCRVSNPFGTVLSREIRVTILPYPPSVSWGRSIGGFVAGTSLTHEVGIRGQGPFTVEWLRDGLPVRRVQQAGEGSVVLEIQKPVHADAGIYAVRVTGPGGTETTSPVVVRSLSGFPPRVALHPAMSAAQAGTTITLTASSIDGFTAEWMKDGVHFATATPYSSTLTLVVGAATAGTYHVRYHNGGGSTDSQPVYVAPAPPEIPVVLRPQGSTRVVRGGNVDLSVIVAGSGPHEYRWTKDGQALAETSAFLRAPAETSGTYRCEISTTAGSVVQEWPVEIVDAPRREAAHLVSHPASADRTVGESLFLFVETDGSNHPGQWFRDGQAIPGATGLAYSKENATATDAGEYWFECPAGDGGLLRSEKAIVRMAASEATVDSLFLSHPSDLAFTLRRGRYLRASLRWNSGTITDLFWEKDGLRLPNSRTDVLSTADLGVTPEGTYVLVLQTTTGEQRSRPARLARITPRPPLVAGEPADFVHYGMGYNHFVVGVDSWEEPMITWFKNGQPISSGMADLPAASMPDEYHAILTNGGGEVRTRTVRVTRGELPWPLRIIRDPASAYLPAGGTITLRVETNLPDVTCQWRLEGVPILGATGREVTATAGGAGTKRSFDVVVSSGGASVVSRPALVEAAPDIPSRFALVFVGVPAITRVAEGATLRLVPEAQYGENWFQAEHQWFKDGEPLANATGPTLVVPAASEAVVGTYRLRLSRGLDITNSAPMVVEVVPASRLMNISARAHAGTGDAIVIPSFVVTGEGERRLMVRVAGDTLYPAIPTALRDPVLQFKRMDGTLLDEDDDWERDRVRGEALAQLMAARCGGVLKRGSPDAALLRSVPAGNYTPHVAGKNHTTGVAVTEVFDLTDGDVPARVVNMAARAKVEAGDGVLILGFVIGSGEPRRLMITGIGPTLATAGVGGAQPDPQLTLYNQVADVIGTNDNWSADATQARALEEAFLQTGAGYLARGTLDAAMIVTLPPGTYSVHVRDTQGRTGIAISELWELP